MKTSKSIKVTKEFKQSLNWFKTFLVVFNGVSLFSYIPSKSVNLDACPSGLGAILRTRFMPWSCKLAGIIKTLLT